MSTEARETAGLIGSDKVEGTYVYDANGEHVGSIERVMIDKRSGQVAYAVLSFGGFLGIGSEYYPIPWQSLKYDTSLGGYRTNITEEQLKARRSTRAIVGTGKIASGAAASTSITACRGPCSNHVLAGRCHWASASPLSYKGVPCVVVFPITALLPWSLLPLPSLLLLLVSVSTWANSGYNSHYQL